MEEFEAAWNAVTPSTAEVPLDVSESQEYQCKDGYARYRLICDVLTLYYSAVHGESRANVRGQGKITFSVE
jgi:hypothetical protein